MEVSRKVKALAGVAEDAAEDALLEAAHVARMSQQEEDAESVIEFVEGGEHDEDEDGLNLDTDSYPNLFSRAMIQNEHATVTFQQLVQRLLIPGVPMSLTDLGQLIPKEQRPSRGTRSLVRRE